ncbi:M14 family zinc carboxypeptidase [Allokutzneria sp. NRRL B-24872]|uniref:M14 family zinc carboxypeptidase n=1 Tax=Allokutzneria sp. NRRL B-24872 TaxID=1137961 RepID=UPI00143D6D3F|nr:M14 family zinc carboxypeptidase [Allokutzneria sp. NRRL B-24872]
MDLRTALDRIPEIDRFPTVEEMQADLAELAAAYPDLVELRRIGTSRHGEPLVMAVIGDGPRSALAFGGPHPNEPVGALTVRELGRLLCAEESLRSGLRWHLVPCVDPDGARLNEDWHTRPGGWEVFGRNFYRPAMDEQVEWTFPKLDEPGYFDRPLPETAALARVIDEVRPALISSLHNGEYGGVFTYVSTVDEALTAALGEVPGWFGVPLHNAVWEVPDSSMLGPGVIRMPTSAEVGGDGSFGASSGDYSARHGTTTIVTEVPYWEDPRAADTSPSGTNFPDLVRATVQHVEEAGQFLRSALAVAQPDLTLDTPFQRSLVDSLGQAEAVAGAWKHIADGPSRPATVAEVCSFDVLPHMFRIRLAGTLLRVLHAELGSGNTRKGVREALASVEARFTEWCAQATRELPGERIAIRRLVAVQVGCTLAAAALV